MRIDSTCAVLLIALASAGCTEDPTDAPGDAGTDTRPGAAGEPCNPDAIGVDTPAGASIDGCDLYTACERGVCRPIADEPIACRDVGAIEGLPALWTKLAPSSSPPERS